LDNLEGHVINYNSQNPSNYSTVYWGKPYTGTNGGVLLSNRGTLYFNNGLPVIQNKNHWPDSTYMTPFMFGARRVTLQDSVTEIYHTSLSKIGIDSNGCAFINLLSYYEMGETAFSNGNYAGLGSSVLRKFNSQVSYGDKPPLYINIPSGGIYPNPSNYITDLSNNEADFLGNPTTTPLQLKVGSSSNTNYAYNLNIDPANPNQIGGFVFNPSLLNGYLDPSATPNINNPYLY